MEGFFIKYVELKSVLNCQLHHEDKNNVELRGEMEFNDILTRVEEIDFIELFNLFDDTLTIAFHKIDFPGRITIKKGVNKEEIKEGLNISFSKQTTLTVTIWIHKAKFNLLIKNILLKGITEEESFKIITIFEKESAFHFFSKTLLEIENDIVHTSWERFVIYLPFLDISPSITPYSILFGKTLPSKHQIQRWFDSNKTIDDIKKQIEKRNINCNWNGGTKFLIPEMFWFEDSFLTHTNNQAVNLLQMVFLKLVFSSLSNFTFDGTHKFLGHRTIEYKILESHNLKNYTVNSLKTAMDIYNFVYETHTTDKLALLRHIITAHSDKKDDLVYVIENLPSIYKSLQNNFSTYIGEKLNLFLDKKLEMEKNARETAKEISEEISSSINYVSRNLLALIGTALIAFIGYSSKANDKILWYSSVSYIIFIVISTTLFAFYSYYKKESALKNFNNYLKMNDFVSEETKNKFRNEIVNQQVTLFKKFWISSIVINIVLIVMIIITTISLLY